MKCPIYEVGAVGIVNTINVLSAATIQKHHMMLHGMFCPITMLRSL